MLFWSIQGLVSYEQARELQLKLVHKRASQVDYEVDQILFLEHEPVITQGKGLQFTGEVRPRHMPLPLHLPSDVAFSVTERGGDLTYHGPGQLVIYPICLLGNSEKNQGLAPEKDLGKWIRFLEQSVIDVLKITYGIDALIKKNATGVWVKDKKIASIGIAVKKWINYHGIAINVINDLSPFHLFSPCGFSSESMTSVSEVIQNPDLIDWREKLENAFLTLWSRGVYQSSTSTIEKISVKEAMKRVASF